MTDKYEALRAEMAADARQNRLAKRVVDAARTAMDASRDDADFNVIVDSCHAASLSLALDEYDAALAQRQGEKHG